MDTMEKHKIIFLYLYMEELNLFFNISYSENIYWKKFLKIVDLCNSIFEKQTIDIHILQQIFRLFSKNDLLDYLRFVLPPDHIPIVLNKLKGFDMRIIKKEKERKSRFQNSFVKQTIIDTRNKANVKIKEGQRATISTANIFSYILSNYIKLYLPDPYQFNLKSCFFFKKRIKNKLIYFYSKIIIKKSLELYLSIADRETKTRDKIRLFDGKEINKIIKTVMSKKEILLDLLDKNLIIKKVKGSYNLFIRTEIYIQDEKPIIDTKLGTEVYQIYRSIILPVLIEKQERENLLRYEKLKDEQYVKDIEIPDLPVSMNGHQCISSCNVNHTQIKKNYFKKSKCICDTDIYNDKLMQYNWDWCNDQDCLN